MRLAPGPKPLRLLVLTLALQSIPGPCPAEFLYFQAGGRVQAPIERLGNRIVVITPSGRYSFSTNDFRSIVPGGLPEREWPARRDAALLAGAEAPFAAAWWALENGLIPEAVTLLRSSRAANPRHELTSRLNTVLDRLDRPCVDPEIDLLSQSLNTSLEIERGPHILLLHQHDSRDARARVDLLERVTTAYYLTLAAQGLDLRVPPRRLVFVSLRDRRDYLAFLESQKATAFRATLGYFHPTFRAVITIDPEPSGKSNAKARKDVSTRPGTVENPDPSHPGLLRSQLLSDLDLRARADGTAAHELIHLLVTESRLAPSPEAFPLWLHEGFAAQFEVFRGGRWSGIGRAHDLRLPDYRSASNPIPLSLLIRDNGFGHGYRRDLYASSWALVFFLRKAHSREFTTFLDLLRVPDPQTPSPDPTRFETLFRDAFGGDLAALEKEWQRFMSDLRLPLDDHERSQVTLSP